jgi:aminoglycoside phosphotransferase (APT) family kinase protein
MSDIEPGDIEPLTGGVNRVVRMGETVVRPAGSHTPTVHRLLWHLHRNGFRQCPRPVSIDVEACSETVSFLPGAVSSDATGVFGSDRALTSAARLLRRLHDASASFPLDGTECWGLPPRSPVEVICHGDFSPYNCVVRHGLTAGVFDFDTAHPGPRSWDIGYAAVRWVTLEEPADGRQGDEQRRRLHLFCRAYGTDEVSAVVDSAALRLLALVDHIDCQVAAGHPAFSRHRDEGHVEHYLGVVDRLRAERAFLCGTPRHR